MLQKSNSSSGFVIVDETTDISRLPDLTFGDVETYARSQSGCSSTTKAYKFCAEPGYLHEIKGIIFTYCVHIPNTFRLVIKSACILIFGVHYISNFFQLIRISCIILVRYSQDLQVNIAKIASKCYRSMKKSEAPHKLEAEINLATKSIKGRCSCVAGAGGFCHHVVGLLFYMAHCKTLGYKAIPDELTCTSMPQRWSVPRERKITTKPIHDVMVKKPRPGANYSKFIKSTLYSPSTEYPLMAQEHLTGLEPVPLMATIAVAEAVIPNITMVPSKFGNVAKGSVLSYQQKLSDEYVINDYFCPAYPTLPTDDAEERIKNNFTVPDAKKAALNAISITIDQAIDIEEKTLAQSASQLWYSLREKRITASKFGIVAKRQSGFENLVKQLNPSKRVVTADMQRGIDLEPKAAMVYANVAKEGKVNVYPSGLVINPKCPWLGCSPDRKVFDFTAEDLGHSPFGLLEVKVTKEGTTDFSTVQYITSGPNGNILKKNHSYYYQVQCQLALTGLDWCDFFSYVSDTVYHCERIQFDEHFFEKSKDKVDSFFFDYFLK